MFDEQFCHLLVGDEQVFVNWMRVIGGLEAEEEIGKVDACCFLRVGRWVFTRCFGDGYLGGPVWFAWHLVDCLGECAMLVLSF